MIDSQTAFEKRNAQLQKFIIGIPRRRRIAAVIVHPQTPISITASVTEVFSLSTLNLLNFQSPLPITRVCHGGGGGGKKRREADAGKWRESRSGGGYELLPRADSAGRSKEINPDATFIRLCSDCLNIGNERQSRGGSRSVIDPSRLIWSKPATTDGSAPR